MAWTKDNGPDGLPLWRGKDAIFNQHYQGQKTNNAIGLGLLGGGVAFLGLASALDYNPVAIGMGLLSFGFGWGMRARSAGRFVGPSWALSAAPDALAFKGGESWSVPLDAVARVETGRTAEYMPSRDFRGLVPLAPLASKSVPQSTPADEWQTFLFLNDGTRRVIYHANAARDDCAALAASIREYVESARAGAAPSIPSTPDAAGGSAPRAAGFDL